MAASDAALQELRRRAAAAGMRLVHQRRGWVLVSQTKGRTLEHPVPLNQLAEALDALRREQATRRPPVRHHSKGAR